MNLLITGSEGFVGKNLVEYFKQAGHVVFAPKLAELDLTQSPQVEQYLNEHEVLGIVHCATTLRAGTVYPPDTCEKNLRMFFNLESCRQAETLLINLGSGSEYCRPFWHRKMSEDFFNQHIPEDSHSYAKYLISRYIEQKQDLKLVGLRIFGIFGKYEDYRYKFISNTIAKNIFGLPIIINQNVVYDYLYIDDFCQIVERILAHGIAPGNYNVTPSESIDLLKIVKLVNEVSEQTSEVEVLNSGIGIEYSGDNSALLAQIGEFDFKSPRDAIRELYQFYQQQKDELDSEALKQDAFLNYAKELRAKYFKK